MDGPTCVNILKKGKRAITAEQDKWTIRTEQTHVNGLPARYR